MTPQQRIKQLKHVSWILEGVALLCGAGFAVARQENGWPYVFAACILFLCSGGLRWYCMILQKRFMCPPHEKELA
jgi:hypothetical protein